MHCFGCCQYSPCDVSTNAHEETSIVSSYILGDLDAFHTMHVSHNCLYHMHTIPHNALDISHDALPNLSLHYAIHNKKPIMMDDTFLYHASHLFDHWIFCANEHKHVCIIPWIKFPHMYMVMHYKFLAMRIIIDCMNASSVCTICIPFMIMI